MRRPLAGALLCGTLLTGCGHSAPQAGPAPALPSSTVPARLQVFKDKVVLKVNRDPRTQAAFTSVGKASLVAKAGVWELRKGVRLVGTLQLVTLDQRVDTARDKDRTDLRQQILSGNPTEFDVDGLPVWSGKEADRVLFVWYGRQVLGVLQVKADSLDPEETANQLISDVTHERAWPGLSLDAFDEQS